MTERGRGAVERTASSFRVGPSVLDWQDGVLSASVDEVAVPLPRPVRGRFRVETGPLSDRAFELDGAARHRWWPIAPAARIEVAFERPALRWSGHAYVDSNAGDVPLEASFARWHWSRADLRPGAVVLYEVTERDGSERLVAVRIDGAGRVEDVPWPAPVRLPPTGWRIGRATRSDPDHPAVVEKTLEDTPFYARSLLATRLLGRPCVAVHESLSLDRFRAPWVQAMLPFRMPRRRR